MLKTATELWESVLVQLGKDGDAAQLAPLLTGLEVVGLSEDELLLRPRSGTLEWLGERERALLESSAARAWGRSTQLRTTRDPRGSSSLVLSCSLRPGVLPPLETPALNENYTFANFVIGPSNRLAHAAATAVSENPGRAYNPLFIHSAVGLGKTHLLQATCHTVLARSERATIVYISCEDFMNLFMSAVQGGDVDSFRHRFRHADVFVVDDVHFLASRERTQEEFFHTFNTLYNSGRHIIISSDSPPPEIPKIEERLLSRFKWGLVAEIERPSYETRLEIIRRKALMRGRELPSEGVEFLAGRATTNVREREGAVLKLLGYASLLGRSIDLDLAEEVLHSTMSGGLTPLISMEEILRAVTRYFKVSLSGLQSEVRSRSLVFPRQVAMYLGRELTTHSLEEIGGHLGGRDHSTVKHACDKIRRLLTNDDHLRGVVRLLKRSISRR